MTALHPAPEDAGVSRDQLIHPSEEARWTHRACGGRGCRDCCGGQLPRAGRKLWSSWNGPIGGEEFETPGQVSESNFPRPLR